MVEPLVSVLYVDDEVSLLEIGKIFLERAGPFTVKTIPSADDALALLATSLPDAIVSDYQMPGMDGIAFLHHVREKFGDIPFILFTGRGREEVVIQAINDGADFYLQKGGDPRSQFAELAHKIRQAVRRKAAERSVLESEKRLSDIINFLPDPTFAIDVTGKVISWNRAIEEMSGVSAEQMLGKGRDAYSYAFYKDTRPLLIDLIDAPDEQILQYYRNLHRTSSSLTAETDVPGTGGSITVLAKVSRLFTQDGQVAGAIQSVKDITGLKKAEHELRRSEERYRSVVNDQTEMIVRFTPDGVITFTNDAYRQYYSTLLGIERFETKNIRDIMVIANYDRVEEFLHSLTILSPTRDMERVVPGKDGEPRWQLWTVRALFDESGSAAEYQVVGRDVTEKKLSDQRLQAAYEQIAVDEEELKEKYAELAISEQQARRSEERLLLALEIGQIGSWEFGPHSGTFRLSTQARAMLGFSPGTGEIMLAELESCLSDAPRFHQALMDLLTHATPFDLEFKVNPVDGSEQKVIHALARSEYISSDDPVAVVGVFQDITLRKQAADEIAFKNTILKTQQEVSPDAILIVDPEGLILGYNQNFLTLWHIPDTYIDHRSDSRLLGYVSDHLGDPVAFLERVRYLYDHPNERSFDEIALKDGRILERYSSPMIGQGEVNYGRVWFFRDISERKRSEYELRAAYEQISASDEILRQHYHELQASEARFRSLFEQGFQLVGVLDPAGILTDANQNALDLIGSDASAVIGHPFWETPWWTHDPGSSEQVRQAITRAATGETVRFETSHIDASGELHYIDFSLKPVIGPDNEVIALLPEGRDITGLKQAEIRAEREREKFRSIFDHSYDAIFIYRLDGSIADVNETMCQMYRVTHDEAIQFTIADYTGPLSRVEEAQGRWKDVIQGKDQFFSWQARRPHDNSVFDVQVYLTRIEWEQGQIILGNVRDVTEIRQTEQKIRLSEERYRSLIETTGTGYVVLDMEGRVIEANNEYIRLTGRSSLQEIAGRPITDWTAPYDLQRNGEEVKRCVQTGSVQRLKIDYIHPNGTIQPVEVNASVFGSGENRVILTLCRDIT